MRLGCGKVEWEVKQENQALLLNLGQLSQLVVDLGVVVHTAKLLGTDTHGVHVDHGTGVGVGGANALSDAASPSENRLLNQLRLRWSIYFTYHTNK